MDWLAELRDKFQRVRAGQAPSPVSFAGRSDTVGELGREFNHLTAELEHAGLGRLTREQVHALRNHLAGILAALQVLGADGELTGEEQARLQEVIEQARGLDLTLRARTP